MHLIFFSSDFINQPLEMPRKLRFRLQGQSNNCFQKQRCKNCGNDSNSPTTSSYFSLYLPKKITYKNLTGGENLKRKWTATELYKFIKTPSVNETFFIFHQPSLSTKEKILPRSNTM